MANTIIESTPIAPRAAELYERSLRREIETEQNIGKMIVIDVDTGAYAIDEDGLRANATLRTEHPEARPESLFAIRIGYNSVFALGGTVTRTLR